MAVKEVEKRKGKGFRAVLPAYQADTQEVELDKLRREAQSALTLQTRNGFRRKHAPARGVAAGQGPDLEPQPPLITT